MEKLYWTMRNGEKIDIDEMTESHLRNALKLIVRRSQQIQTKCPTDCDMVEQESPSSQYDSWYIRYLVDLV